ncbi:Hypothetical protein CINCED_3A004504 [Cinara cedri]|uniref:Uncharacterized protein n=1 Tax=Cinara cedri TaxID=506608 RepID=A0A5E4MAG6_9HEMI|nr:Hypothetical protein CINCED_3A004504 [Cinara cedri]
MSVHAYETGRRVYTAFKHWIFGEYIRNGEYPAEYTSALRTPCQMILLYGFVSRCMGDPYSRLSDNNNNNINRGVTDIRLFDNCYENSIVVLLNRLPYFLNTVAFHMDRGRSQKYSISSCMTIVSSTKISESILFGRTSSESNLSENQ